MDKSNRGGYLGLIQVAPYQRKALNDSDVSEWFIQKLTGLGRSLNSESMHPTQESDQPHTYCHPDRRLSSEI